MARIILFLVTLFPFIVQSQCNVTIQNTTLDTLDVPCGDSVFLQRDTLGAYAIFTDFNNGAVGLGWQTTSNAALNNPCGSKGNTYLWFGNTSTAPRNLTTLPLDLSCGGQICFELRFSVQGGAQPCEGPDLPGEGVTFEWRQGTGPWFSIFYFQPNVTGSYNSLSPGSGDYTGWATYCFPIPTAAQAANIQLRWQQYASTAAGNDHWGIDSITVSTNCGAVDNLWSTGDTTASTFAGIFTNNVDTVWTRRIVGVGSSSPDTCWDSVVVRSTAPVVNANPTWPTYCDGEDATVNVGTANLVPGVTYNTTWSTGFDTTTNTQAIKRNLIADTTGWYRIQHPLYPYCSATDTFDLSVGGVKFDSVNILNPTCYRDGNGEVTFVWYDELSFPINTLWNGNPRQFFSGGIQTNYMNLPADTYTLTIRDARCYDTVGFRIKLPDTVRVDTAGIDLQICQTSFLDKQVTATGGSSPYTFYWDGVAWGNTLSVKSMTDTIIDLYVEDAVGCVSDTLPVLFTLPDPISVSIQADTVCPGLPVTMRSITTGGRYGYQYLWKDGSTADTAVTVSKTGRVYSVTVEDGCVVAASDSVTLYAYPLVDSTIQVSDVCEGEQVQITAPFGAASYSVVVNGTEYADRSVTVPGDIVGTWPVSVQMITVDGCVVNANDTYRVVHQPVADFSWNRNVDWSTDQLIEFVSNSEYANEWQWRTIESAGNGEQFTTSFSQPGEWRVWLTVSNDLGCADSTHKTINIRPDVLIYIPNSFSPNNDMLNDEWSVIVPNHVTEYHCWVYDRWGNLVWETTDKTASWDGSGYPIGTYNYRIFAASPMYIDFKQELCGTIFIVK